ncbi:hypothetical protein BGZ81_009498 [Podila clonocystis]|nr:hypothetical protein BGZ81_009498 [Podila clonocystis]
MFKDAFADLIGVEGILISEGTKWKVHRKLVSHIFNFKTFREYTRDVFVVEGKKVTEYNGKAADARDVVELQYLMFNFTLNCLGEIAYGKSFGCLDNIKDVAPFAVSLGDLITICSRRLVDPSWKIHERLTGVDKKVYYHMNLIRSYAFDILENAKKKIILLTRWTSFNSNTLKWMFYLIYREVTDRDIANTLVQEVDNVLRGSDPMYETRKKQKFAEACFYEALRLFPAIPWNMRYSAKDDVLPEGTKSTLENMLTGAHT